MIDYKQPSITPPSAKFDRLNGCVRIIDKGIYPK